MTHRCTHQPTYRNLLASAELHKYTSTAASVGASICPNLNKNINVLTLLSMNHHIIIVNGPALAPPSSILCNASNKYRYIIKQGCQCHNIWGITTDLIGAVPILLTLNIQTNVATGGGKVPQWNDESAFN